MHAKAIKHALKCVIIIFYTLKGYWKKMEINFTKQYKIAFIWH